MANYLAQLDQFNEVQSPLNIDLIGKVMQAKQGKYDQNLAKIDETLAQLKVQENLLLRQEDKEYFANNVQSLIDTVNRSGKMNITSNGLTRQITGQIKTVLDDEYTLAQMSNSIKVRNFYSEIEKKKEKNPELYSDINFNDAVKQAGLDKYMAGEVDQINNLQYKDYVNAPKVLNESVSKWAKDHGYKKEVDSQGNDYFITTTTKEVLSKDEILNFIQSTLDPNIQAQLDIDARHKYGGLGQEQLQGHLKERTEAEIVNYESELGKYLAMQKKDSNPLIQERIDMIKEQIGNKRKKIETNSFDPNEIYGLHRKDLFNGIAEAYDRNIVTDVEYSTIPLEIAKFQMDKEFKAETLRLKKLELDNKYSDGTSKETGTVTPDVPEMEDKPDDLTQVRQSFVETQTQLMQVLQAEDADYQALETKEAKQAYINNILQGGTTINPNNNKPLKLSVINAANSHKSNFEAYTNYRTKVIQGIDTKVTDAYNDMLTGLKSGSDLNVNNLAKTMPQFAKALKGGKQFSQLSPQEREALRYEFVSNAKNYGGDSDNEENYQMYLNNVKQRKAAKNNPMIPKEEEESGYVSGMMDWFGATPQYIKGVFQSNIGAAWEQLTQGKVAAEKKRAEGFSNQLEGAKKMTEATEKANRSYMSWSSPEEDRDITEVEGRDTGSGKDAWFTFKQGVDGTVKTAKEGLKPYLQTMPERVSFSYSTEIKEQERTTELLKQVILNNNGAIPAEGANNYTLKYSPQTKQFTISYLAKQDKVKVQTEQKIDLSLMPKEIQERFRTSKEDWSTSPNNPKATIAPFVYVPPKTDEEAVRSLENLKEIAPNTFSDKDIYNLTYSPLFQKPEDKYNTIVTIFPEIAQGKNKREALTKLVTSNIEVVPVVAPGQGFFADVYLVTNGVKKRISKQNEVPLGKSYDPQDFLKKQLEIVGMFTDREIQNILKLEEDNNGIR